MQLAVDEGVNLFAWDEETSPDGAGAQFLVNNCLTDRPDGRAAIGCRLWDGEESWNYR